VVAPGVQWFSLVAPGDLQTLTNPETQQFVRDLVRTALGNGNRPFDCAEIAIVVDFPGRQACAAIVLSGLNRKKWFPPLQFSEQGHPNTVT